MASLNVIYRIIKVFLIQDVQGFMLQLLEALSFAHERNIAHLDIKVRSAPTYQIPIQTNYCSF